MGELWDKFKKNMYYEEPEVKSGTRKKSTKELEQEKDIANIRVKQIQNERKQILNDYGIKTDETGNVKRTVDLDTNPLSSKKSYKDNQLVDTENIKKSEEFKSSEDAEKYNALTNPLVKNWNERALLNEEINKREAEREAQGYGTIAKIGASLGTGVVNKLSGLTRNSEDAILDESGNPLYYTKSRTEIDSEAYRNSLSGVAGGLYDLGNLVGEMSTQYIPGVGQTLYFGDIAMDKYNENLRNGVDAKDAFINATGVSIVDYLKQKALGSLGSRASRLESGAEKSLENAFEKGFSHIIGNKSVNKILSGTSAEFLDEFTDSIVEQMWDNITINKNGIFEGMDSPEFWKQATYEGLLGGIMGLGGASIKVGSTSKSQRASEQAVYDYERKTGNKMSEFNKNTVDKIVNLYDSIYDKTPTSQEILDSFERIKTNAINDFQTDSLNKFPTLDDAHRTQFNEMLNDMSQVIYDTGVNIRLEPTQTKLIDWDNGTLVLNPTQTAEPLKNIVLHEISKQTVDSDTQNYIIDKLKEDGVYETYKNELLATGEFDELNVDQEIVAQELDAIFQNENEIKELAEKDKGLFNSIKDTFNTLTGKLTNNRNTRDALYFREVNDRINSLYGEGDLNDLSKISDNLINNTNEEETTLKSDKNMVVDENGNEIKEQYKSNEKLPETTKPGTYIEPTKPIDTTTKKGKKYLQQISGEGIKSTLLKTKSKNYTAFFDKLNPIQQIADASGNTQLYAKYNNRGMSNGMGQYQIGTAQTDINGREIGKSLNDIWRPIEDANLTTQFDDYLAHRLNEERYDKVPVWDESITPEMSREIIDNYDSQYPQFKAWADEIYKYNDNQLQKMIDAGLSKENARDWLYKNYVTISRDLVPKTNPLVQNAKGVKVNSPIRKAKGGDADIRPMKEAMARQTLLTENAIADNIAGQELLNVLGGTVGDTNTFLTQDLEGNNNALMQNEDGTYNYTVYKNGVPVTMQITKEVADAIRPTKRGEWEEYAPFKVIREASKLQRALLTDKNPLFIFTNFFKDIGDAPLNSKYSGGQFYANYPVAVAKMLKKDSDWKQYVAKGGKENTYFDTKEGEVKLSKNPIKRTAQKFSQLIENANQFIEQAPRFNEYLLTLQNGGTLDEALYNSAEVTTNFARGGEITKALNRNGFNFLNASVQGFDKQIRNFTKQPGAKGYVQLLAKVAIFGIAPAMLNHMLLEDDDDYKELPDYIKDNYYLFKTGDNKFIRIPKGRVMSIFGTSARHTYETVQGNENILQGLKDTGEQLVNNVAPNNPIENNVASPILSVINNRSWNGSAIVSTRLQNLPESEQYDEKTSSIAKWLGQTLEGSLLGKSFDFSPKKIDYLLDQYTGAIGDFVLPMTTPSAENEFNTIPGKLIASPFVSKFTSDSTISSKYVSEFYDTKDKLEKEMKLYSSIEESEESFEKSIQAKYLASVNEEVAELYAQKREIQNSDLDDKTKYNQAKAIQRKIDDIAKFALQDYTEGYYTDDYAVIGDKEYYITYSQGKPTWSKVDEKTKKKQEEYSLKYDISPEGYFEMKPLSQSASAGSIENYNKYYQEIKNIQSKTSEDKEETIKYINNLDLSMPQKAMMIKTFGYKFDDYNDEIFNYVNSLNMIPEQKQEILIYLGFEYNKNTKQFSWK